MSILKKITTILLASMVFSVSTGGVAIAEEFSDLEEGDAHFVAIKYLQEQGIIEGYEDNTFKAYQKINRAEAIKMLTLASKALSEEEVAVYEKMEEMPFNDVSTQDWYTKYLAAAKEKGIIDGYPDGNFYPLSNVNLAESLKILLESAEPEKDFASLEYQNLDQLYFTDTPVSDWYTPYSKYAASLGILDINSDDTIHPNQEMTRGLMAELIYRYLKSGESQDRFGKATWYGSAVQGNGTASGATFDSNLLTAAHKYLEFGTLVEVTNLANGKSVTVEINDRGPYGHGRVLDLSSTAYAEIASLGSGIINVQYKIVHLP